MLNLQRNLLVVGAFVALPFVAVAQEAPAETTLSETVAEAAPAPASSGRYPINNAKRPLNLGAKILRADLDFLIAKPPIGDAGIGLALGAAFGITDDLEVGATVLPLSLSPSTNYGDIPIYGQYRFLSGGALELGAQLGLRIPTSTDFGLRPGLRALYASGNLSISADVFLNLTFSDPLGKALEIPVSIQYNFAENFYAALNLGIFLPEFDALVIPLGLQAYYTIAQGSQPMLDVGASFTFPTYIQTIGGDALVLDNFVIGLSGKFYLYL